MVLLCGKCYRWNCLRCLDWWLCWKLDGECGVLFVLLGLSLAIYLMHIILLDHVVGLGLTGTLRWYWSIICVKLCLVGGTGDNILKAFNLWSIYLLNYMLPTSIGQLSSWCARGFYLLTSQFNTYMKPLGKNIQSKSYHQAMCILELLTSC